LFAVTTPAQRGEQQVLGGIGAADHLDDDIDVVPADQPGGVRGQQAGGDLRMTSRPADGNRDQVQLGADPGGQLVGLLGQQPHDLRADDPGTEDSDPHGRRAGHRGPPGRVTSRKTRNA
jgi:hypothetical protein